ncbi:MAG: DUF1820 family protein [Chitinophagaceae bacterium]|nr:DUF1820 family protein [Oligoflexus sp.]
MVQKRETIFRVRFLEKHQDQALEVLVRQIQPSNLPGLVCLSHFVFKDSTKKIILPEEDVASKRFRRTQSLHIPYHNILLVEEIIDEEADVHQLPFLRPLNNESETKND